MPTRPINNATVIKDIRVVMGLELEKLSCRDERHFLGSGQRPARDCRAATARAKGLYEVKLGAQGLSVQKGIESALEK